MRMMAIGILCVWVTGACPARGAELPREAQSIPGCPTKMEFVKMPAGKIEMPTTRPGVKAEIVEVRSVWISRTEVTWDAFDSWRLILDSGRGYEPEKYRGVSWPSGPAYSNPDYDFGHRGYAAISIHPNMAQWYCRWLSDKTGRKFRLPTEAEWEYACRCGGPELKPTAKELEEIAWFAENSKNAEDDPVPHPVGAKAPNAWGLYDMLGNVGEWVMGYDGQPVLKGGSFRDEAADISSRAREPLTSRLQFRDPHLPKDKWWLSDGPHAGFRIVREE